MKPVVTTLLAAAVLGLAPASRADAPPSTTWHDWEGTLDAGPEIKLRLVFHVRERPDGRLSATFDSPDQGAAGLSVGSVTRDKTRLVFEIPTLMARFEGTLNADGTEAVGTWTQGPASLPLTLKKSERPAPRVDPDRQSWEGSIRVGEVSLRLVLNVRKGDGGALAATLDSPDQMARGIRVDRVTLDKERLAFEIEALKARFRGALNADGTEAVGTFTQAGTDLPLTLERVDRSPAPVRRPQTPRPPFPYVSKNVTYRNDAAGVTLAGTLTEPEGPGPFPAVLLITGSGAQDRDETILGHKPFLVLADALTRRGVAVLRVDDRGVGGSSGKNNESTTEDFADDALSGVAFLKARPEIDGKAIGLIGHSEGGLIAPLAASRSGDVAFLVLLAGTGLPGEDIVTMQSRLIAAAMGADEKALDTNTALQKRLFAVLRAEPDREKALAGMRAAVRSTLDALPEPDRKALGNLEALVEGQLRKAESPWFRFFLTYDPRPMLAKVHCPVLALFGEKDLQVPPRENLDAIGKALRDGGNTHVTLEILPGLNHLFQTCKTGSPAEYARIEETIAPAVLQRIGDWILEQPRGE